MTAAISSEPGTPAKTGRGPRKRRATERQIIDAFDRLVRREGLRNVRVNAVIKEAGIGKALLYNYFGGLPGLVKAWGEREQLWPDVDELIGDMPSKPSGDPAAMAQALAQLVQNHAESLRDEPLRVELLADEFMVPTAISEALAEVRRQLGREHQAVFERLPALQKSDAYALFSVVMAAATFLAMRGAATDRDQEKGGGADHVEEGWASRMARLRRVVGLAVLGMHVDQMVKGVHKSG